MHIKDTDLQGILESCMSTELFHRDGGKEERKRGGRRERKKSASFEVKPKKIGKKQRSLLSFDTFLRPRIHIRSLHQTALVYYV